MTRFGLVLGLGMAVGLSAWAFARGADAPPARAAEADTVEGTAGSGTTQDEALHRYRTNQSRHWRHVMIGGR